MGVSAATGEGVEELFFRVDCAVEDYNETYLVDLKRLVINGLYMCAWCSYDNIYGVCLFVCVVYVCVGSRRTGKRETRRRTGSERH